MMDGQSQPSSATTSDRYPQARHHTYLPGIITPLVISSPIYNTSNHSGDGDGTDAFSSSYSDSQQHPQLQYQDEQHRPSWVQELAVLELSPDNGNDDDDTHDNSGLQGSGNIVIFPGSIVPLRLLDHEWITYLQQKIHTITSSATTTNTTASSSVAAPVVRFGILMPRPTNIDDNDEPQNNRTGNGSSIPEQRQSWTRQAHGPNTLRRLSDQLIQELGPDFEYDDDSDNDDIDIRNLNSTMITDPEAAVREQQINNNERNMGATIGAMYRNALAIQVAARRQSDNNTNRMVPMVLDNFGRSNVEEDMTNFNALPRQFMQQSLWRQYEQNRRRRRRSRQSVSSSNSRSNNDDDGVMDRYIGRIGTIATVLYTHGNENSSNNENSGSSSSSASLVITAIGTSRFRIIGYRNDDEQSEYKNINNRHHHFSMSRRRRHGNLKHFLVQELKDVPMKLPSHIRYQLEAPINIPESNDERTAPTTLAPLKYYEHYLQYLSIVSPYPKFILQKMWPWKIMADICHYIQIVAPTLLRGFLLSSATMQQRERQNGETSDDSRNGRSSRKEGSNGEDDLDLPSVDTLISSKDPIAFSYWMATNLPFRYEEKIKLLEICSTIERLKYIYDKLRNDQLCATMINCIQCKSPLAFAHDMFTVDGADGTTGNYVNEYGHVHQTITLRNIDDDGVWYQGQPQSQDSWFPGYCWTIMACSVCGHHLGWKFTLSNSGSINGNNPQRPSTFYGVSAANISTFVPYEVTL